MSLFHLLVSSSHLLGAHIEESNLFGLGGLLWRHLGHQSRSKHTIAGTLNRILTVTVHTYVSGNPDLQAIGGWARQVYASLGKSAATGNPGEPATGSWARQV